MSNVKFFNNDEGVSPIVATLVLIVVAIVGAAAVGLIMGSFSTNVSNQANNGNTAAASSTTISVAGSSSMLPTITTLAGYYTSNNTGVKVNVVGGGSGAGCIAVGSGIADIGMMSENPTSAQMTKYPNLQKFQVGASGVVFAVAKGTVTGTNNVSRDDLAYAFGYDGTNWGKQPTYINSVAALGTINETVTRSDVSGTSDTAYTWMGSTAGTVQPTGTGISAQNGNGAVATEILASQGHIGYLESDYAFGSNAAKFTLLNLYEPGTPAYTTTETHVLDQIMYNPSSKEYPTGLLRSLNLVTNGAPSSIEQAFINYISSPNSQTVFKANHQVHLTQIASTLTL